MADTNNLTEFFYGVVIGGQDDDVPKEKDSSCRIFDPTKMSNEFSREDCPFVKTIGTGDQMGDMNFSGPPEDGSFVLCRKTLGHKGTSFVEVIGVCKDPKNSLGQSLPGNFDIRSFTVVDEAFKRKRKINEKAKAGSGEAGSKPTEQAGQGYYRDLVKALPASSTLWEIAGMKIPQEKSIETATQAFSAIMSADALGSLPGMALSFSNIFKMMPAELMSQLTSALPPEVNESLTAVMNLMPEIEPSGLSGPRINPEIFFVNAVEILSKCRTTTELMDAITELMTNTSLYGTDTLPPVTVDVPTPFGNVKVSFDTSGNNSEDSPGGVTDLLNTFTSLLSDASGAFPGVLTNKNMWGQSASVMGDMMKRLETGEYTKAVQQAQKSIAAGTQPRTLLNNFKSVMDKASDILA